MPSERPTLGSLARRVHNSQVVKPTDSIEQPTRGETPAETEKEQTPGNQSAGRQKPSAGPHQATVPKKKVRSAGKPCSGKPARKPKPADLARAGSKTARVLALLQRPQGATLPELRKATGWQPHSVRGFLSGVVGKKMTLKLESERRPDGERVYSIRG